MVSDSYNVQKVVVCVLFYFKVEAVSRFLFHPKRNPNLSNPNRKSNLSCGGVYIYGGFSRGGLRLLQTCSFPKVKELNINNNVSDNSKYFNIGRAFLNEIVRYMQNFPMKTALQSLLLPH